MFTGIIAAVGRIQSVVPTAEGSDAGVRLEIDAGGLSLDDVALGDSIAVSGACMTVTQKTDRAFFVDVSHESLMRTVGLNAIGSVNLEKALRLGDALGGHMVSGHVDGVGIVQVFEPVGESYGLIIEVEPALARFLAYKGSLTVNGVSLTVNSVEDGASGARVSINLIPHTLAATTLYALKAGSRVNLEVDMIARYVERMLTTQGRVVSLPAASGDFADNASIAMAVL